MEKKNIKSSAPSTKRADKSVLKIAQQNVAKKTAEIKNKIKAKQQKSKASATKKQQNGKNTVTSNRLKLLITIVSRNKAEFYLDLIQSFDVNMQCLLLGQGTANQSMLGLLGLSDSDKAVIFSVIQENKIADALQTLESRFSTIKGGKGVACTISISSVIGVLIYGFLSNNQETVKEANNGK